MCSVNTYCVAKLMIHNHCKCTIAIIESTSTIGSTTHFVTTNSFTSREDRSILHTRSSRNKVWRFRSRRTSKTQRKCNALWLEIDEFTGTLQPIFEYMTKIGSRYSNTICQWASLCIIVIVTDSDRTVINDSQPFCFVQRCIPTRYINVHKQSLPYRHYTICCKTGRVYQRLEPYTTI